MPEQIETMADRLLRVVTYHAPEEQHPKSKIAKICGISQSAVYQWFKGATKEPKAVHVGAVCKFYGANAIWVLVGAAEDKKCPNEQKSQKDSNDTESTIIGTDNVNESIDLSDAAQLGNVSYLYSRKENLQK